MRACATAGLATHQVGGYSHRGCSELISAEIHTGGICTVSYLMRKLREARRPATPKAGARWMALDPPPLSIRDLWGDIQTCWRREHHDAPWWKRCIFSALRIIQHVAYRRGYGPNQFPADVPALPTTDLHTMDRNLVGLPPDDRRRWLLSFLGHINRFQGSTAPWPRSVVLELTGTCNLNCTMCGLGQQGQDPSRVMQPADLASWAMEACREAQVIRINGLGEATLHPQFSECLAILDGLPGGREIITNFTAPTRTYIDLLHRRFTILVSWDGCTPTVFEGIRRGADFAGLVARLREVVSAAHQMRVPPPVLLFTAQPANFHELPGTVALAGDCGIERLIVNMLKPPTGAHEGSDWTEPFGDRLLTTFDQAEAVARNAGILLALPDHLGDRPVPSASACRSSASGCAFPHSQVVIHWDGEVTPCNMMNPYSYGNLRQRTFTTCWNGPEARTFRQLAGSRRRHPYCRGCYWLDVTRTTQNGDPPLAGLQGDQPLQQPAA